jgi:hypothetical protein
MNGPFSSIFRPSKKARLLVMQLQFLWIFPGTYQLCERKIMRFFRGKENNGLFTITGEKLTGVIFGSCFNP